VEEKEDEEDDDEIMENFSLKAVLKDYLDTDPSTRYQIARNAFERSLTDAVVCYIIFRYNK